jgi:tetratricopeptide (TPR) repeat protein
MVGSFGEVQVMDWGLAKVLPRGGIADDEKAGQPDRQETVIATARSGSDAPGLSHPGSAMGTPAYMAPEQARGEGDRVDERADVFALGSILCEILTGEPAFLGRSSAEIMRNAALGDMADALVRLNACGAEAELVALARDCLAREAEDRPRHAGAVAARVTTYLAGVQDRVQAAERERAVAEARAVEERKRRKLQLGLAGCLLALTTVGGLGTTYYLQQHSAWAAALERGTREALTLRAVAEQEPEKVERWEAVVAAWRQAEAALGPGSDPRAPAIVAAHLRDAQEHADAALRDRALLAAATEVRANQLDLGLAWADSAYARAFREADLDLDTLQPTEAGERLKTRPPAVAVAAAAALDDWALVRREDRPKESRWRRPVEAARVADPDPFRDRVRAALLEPDDAAREVALRKLVADPAAAALPPPSTVLLAASLKDDAAAVDLLRAATARNPDDAWVNYALGVRLAELRPAPREEQVRYLSMARAARPETAHILAHLLDNMQRTDEALAVFADLVARRPGNVHHLWCYGLCLKDHGRPEAARVLERFVAAGREAIRLDPGDPRAYFHLGLALTVRGELEPAIASYREAIRLRPDDTLAHNNLGLALVDRGELEPAIASYREAIRLKPNYAEAHCNLGHALRMRGLSAEALAECREAIRLKPDDAEAHFGLGYTLREMGRLDEGISEFRQAIRLKPDYVEAHFNLGYALGSQGKIPEAIAEYRETIRLKPDYVKAHFNIGVALAGQEKASEAVAEYREAIRLKPDLAEAHCNLGDALCSQGKVSDAIAEYREAIRLKPDNAEAHSHLDHALRKRGLFAEAMAECREVIRLKPDVPEAHIDLGNTLRALGRHDEGISEFRQAIRLKPDYAEAHTSLGAILCDVKRDYSGAEAEFREAIRLKPDYAEAHFNLGNALGRQGKVPEAIAKYRDAIRLKPDYVEAHFNLGYALGSQGKIPEAIAEFRKAIRLKPDYAEAHVNLGDALGRQGKVPDAIAEHREAMRLKPDLAEAHFNLGKALAGQGKVSEAIAEYRDAIRLEPDMAEAHCNLGLILRQQGDYARALIELRRGHELGSTQPGWRYPSAQWVLDAERSAALATRLSAILKGDDHVGDTSDRLALAQMCYDRKLHAGAARFWAEALNDDPKLADDRRIQHRYNAACAAALAAAGAGKDEPPPDDGARARLRAQALGWLTAEHAAWAKVLEVGDAKARPFVIQTLEHWRVDPDLAGIRDAAALAKLSEPERKPWQVLWSDVDTLLARARGGQP